MSLTEFLAGPLWQRWELTLLHFLWQGTAVAAFVVLVQRLFAITTPTSRYALFLGGLIAMAISPPVTFFVLGDLPAGRIAKAELSSARERATVADSRRDGTSAGDELPQAEFLADGRRPQTSEVSKNFGSLAPSIHVIEHSDPLPQGGRDAHASGSQSDRKARHPR